METSQNLRLLLDLKRQQLEQGQPQVFRGRGLSMFPNLLPGVPYLVRRFPPARLLPGDLVVLAGEDGQWLAHRLLRLDDGHLHTQGDACSAPDPPAPASAYVGKLVGCRIGPLTLPVSLTEPLFRVLLGTPSPALCLSAAALVRRVAQWLK